MNYLAACCIFKDELRYLPEWLEYHRLVGVEHFYLVSNDDSPQASRELLAPYIDAGLVTFSSHPGGPFVSLQTTIYLEVLATAIGRVRWLAFLDVDEFLLPVREATVPSVLKDYERHAGLVVSWSCFGASRRRTPPALQTEGYNLRLADAHDENRPYKSIIDPARTIGVQSPHRFIHRDDEPAVDEFGQPVRHPWRNENNPFFGERLRVNHYRTRSEQEFREKLERWKLGQHPDFGHTLSAERVWNTVNRASVLDERIQRFVPELKRRLAGRGA